MPEHVIPARLRELDGGDLVNGRFEAHSVVWLIQQFVSFIHVIRILPNSASQLISRLSLRHGKKKEVWPGGVPPPTQEC